MATLTGDDNDNILIGKYRETNMILSLGGSDIIFGGNLGDEIQAGDGDDYIYARKGKDHIDGGTGNDVIHSGNGDDSIISGSGADMIHSGNGGDTIYLSSAGPDKGTKTVFAGGGNDLIFMGEGTDSIHGGRGQDRVSYANVSVGVGVTVSLITGTATGAYTTGDTFKSVEDVEGTKYDDFLIGNGVSNVLNGGHGEDRIQGGYGADFLDGGELFDTLDYLDSTAGVTINLATGGAFGGSAEGDQFFSFENVYGSHHADHLTGNRDANELSGFGGDDRLVGGAGADLLTGGMGADHFIFRKTSHSLFESRDLIADFRQVEGDRIDLSRIDADRAVSGNQGFSFIGTSAFTGAAGQIRYEQGSATHVIVSADNNGDGVADFGIHVRGVASLVADDFIL